MANITSVKQKITEEETEADDNLTVDLFTNYGQAINYLIDTVDDHAARISDLSDTEASSDASDVGSGQYLVSFFDQGSGGSSTATVATNTITPNSTNVLIACAGFVTVTFPGRGSVSLTVKRGTATIKSLSLELSSSFLGFALSSLNCVDTGASADSLNTYTVEVSVIGAGVFGSNEVAVRAPSLQLIGR